MKAPSVSRAETPGAAVGSASKSMTPAVRISELTRTFAGRGATVNALGPVSLTIQDGEFIALLGPSGCGKTTLLNIIAGLLPPTSGRIEIHGEEAVGIPRDIGMMFQKAVLLPWRNVLDNILLPVEVSSGRAAARAAKPRAEELLEMVGLAAFAERMPKELSGGMQQRAAICRMLIENPKLLLLDEPFGALDEFTREYMNMELLKMTASRGSTAVLVTHSVSEAVFMADRVVVMSARPGQIAGVVEVALPAERDPEIMTSSDFQEYVREARRLLKLGHRSPSEESEARQEATR